jgi:hypothetical protein
MGGRALRRRTRGAGRSSRPAPLPVGLVRGAVEDHRLAGHRILEPVALIDHGVAFRLDVVCLDAQARELRPRCRRLRGASCRAPARRPQRLRLRRWEQWATTTQAAPTWLDLKRSARKRKAFVPLRMRLLGLAESDGVALGISNRRDPLPPGHVLGFRRTSTLDCANRVSVVARSST